MNYCCGQLVTKLNYCLGLLVIKINYVVANLWQKWITIVANLWQKLIIAVASLWQKLIMSLPACEQTWIYFIREYVPLYWGGRFYAQRHSRMSRSKAMFCSVFSAFDWNAASSPAMLQTHTNGQWITCHLHINSWLRNTDTGLINFLSRSMKRVNTLNWK